MTAHSALWIERAFRTEPADPAIIEEAIKGIYVAANLAEPRVIVVPSPFVMAMAGGIASFWWYLFENKLLGKKRGASGDDLTFAPFFEIWHLNGVCVEQWMAESHPEDMDARRVLQFKNVDRRRECIRRMDMERIIGPSPKRLAT
jgi:hypothetical protein